MISEKRGGRGGHSIFNRCIYIRPIIRTNIFLSNIQFDSQTHKVEFLANLQSGKHLPTCTAFAYGRSCRYGVDLHSKPLIVVPMITIRKLIHITIAHRKQQTPPLAPLIHWNRHGQAV